MRATVLLLYSCVIRYVQYVTAAGQCSITKERLRYDFVIGILCPTAGVSPLQEWVDRNSGSSTCFNTPHFVNLRVQDRLHIPKDGWTEIQAGIDDAVGQQANTKRDVGLSVVIGPFYMNLAIILEDIGIPYVVTDYMGFDWSDISSVDDHVLWNNMIAVRPPMEEFNSAVVDFLVLKRWESAVMIMPENPKDNQECQNLARQMVEHNISPISYSLRVTSRREMKDNTKEVLRNVQLLQQKRIIICSPRDETHNLIQIVLDEASLFNMMSDPDYSFFILDPTTHLKALSEINMYRKGLFAANCDLYAYRYKSTNDSKVYDSAYAFGAIDAAHIIYQAKYWYPTTRLPNEPGIAKTDDFSKERFLQALKNVNIPDAETGEILFNGTGSRVNYTLSLYNHGGIDLYQKVGVIGPYYVLNPL